MSAKKSAKLRRRVLQNAHFASGGFLLAVLWIDLMFDTLVLERGFGGSPLSTESLDVIQVYYRRVTHGADPMRLLVALAMTFFAVGGVFHAIRSQGWIWLRVTSGVFATLAAGLAMFRIVPHAQRLAFAELSAKAQSQLAEAIFRDHICCFVAVALVLCIQLTFHEPEETA